MSLIVVVIRILSYDNDLDVMQWCVTRPSTFVSVLAIHLRLDLPAVDLFQWGKDLLPRIDFLLYELLQLEKAA